jgi:CRP/FNR family transcriptional regulator
LKNLKIYIFKLIIIKNIIYKKLYNKIILSNIGESLYIVDTLSNLNFFKSLNNKQIELLSTICTIKNYDKEYILYYEKDLNKKLFFLVEGLAKAYKIDKHDNEIFLYYIYKNNMITEISDINKNELISFTNIQLIEDSTILSVDYQLFKKYFIDNNLLCLELAKETIKRSTQMQSLISREFIFDAVSKVAMMLDKDLDMFNKLKRHDVSLILHIQPETLSRVLNKLKRNKIIDIIQGKVIIINKIDLVSIYI